VIETSVRLLCEPPFVTRLTSRMVPL
jgi:hypothetical protein